MNKLDSKVQTIFKMMNKKDPVTKYKVTNNSELFCSFIEMILRPNQNHSVILS